MCFGTNNNIYSIGNTKEGVRNMTKHTNKLLVTFEHPEILQQFNDYFIKQYGTVRGHRTKVLEKLIANFNTTKTIQKFEPEYLQKIKDLQDQVAQLQVENTKISEDNNIQITKNTKNLEQIKELTNQLENYHSVIEENVRLHETIKKHENTIDNMNTIQEIQKNRILELTEELQELKQLNKEHENNIYQLTNKHENTIKELNSTHSKEIEKLNNKITSKDNRYKHIEERNEKLNEENNNLHNTIGKYSYVIGYIDGMGIIDRIRKNYPEEIKELKP